MSRAPQGVEISKRRRARALRATVVSVAFAAALPSGVGVAHHPAEDVRTLYDGAVTGPAEMVPGPKYLVLDTPEELDVFYRLHLPDQRLPVVDFDASVVLAAVSGFGPETDPRIHATGRTFESEPDVTIVTVVERGCAPCATLANDVHLVSIRRVVGVVAFGSRESGLPYGIDVVPPGP